MPHDNSSFNNARYRCQVLAAAWWEVPVNRVRYHRSDDVHHPHPGTARPVDPSLRCEVCAITDKGVLKITARSIEELEVKIQSLCEHRYRKLGAALVAVSSGLV